MSEREHRLNLPPDIVGNWKELAGVESKEDMQKLAQLFTMLGDRSISVIL